MSMEQKLQQCIKNRYNIEQAVLTSRPDPKFGDIATNVALQLAKKVGKNPREIAEELADDLRKENEYTDVSIAGPGFINARISAKVLHEKLCNAWSEKYGENNNGAGKTVVVEYPSPNMAKPYSVGHLRPGNQGWAVKRLMEANGWRVITDNHLGDYGAPFGVWALGYETLSNPEALKKDGVYELGRLYIATKKALKEEAERGEHKLADSVQDWLLRLEAGEKTAVEYSKLFNSISLSHIHEVMERLKIATDYEYGEAFFAPKGKAAVERLLERGVAVKNDDGSVIVPLDEYGYDVPLLVQKSNGAALYATTDLATILFREKEWSPDKVVYCVGAEQQFYFSQLFAMAKKLDITTDLYHLWFGVIDQMNEDGTREKMSSRKGVVLMEELLDVAEAKARETTAGRNVSDEDVKKVALGAIKYNDFISDRRTNILFDWSTIFALTGKSGPYVQYAAVRVAKILRDNTVDVNSVACGDYDYEAEKSIIQKLLEYKDVVRQAADDLEPHKIAGYVYELAREMNRYYDNTPVATGSVSQLVKIARLGVLEKVLHVFTHSLDLLGIEVPEKM